MKRRNFFGVLGLGASGMLFNKFYAPKIKSEIKSDAIPISNNNFGSGGSVCWDMEFFEEGGDQT